MHFAWIPFIALILTTPPTPRPPLGPPQRGPEPLSIPEYSFSAGGGQFYALRHHKPGAAPYVEVIGSDIAMNRAKRQAREGGYTLDIKGPFGGLKEATECIREEWDPRYGKPKKPIYTGTPHPHVTRSPEEVKGYMNSR